MVNIDIPKHYTASPSSFSGTPLLTINHDATIDLDSSSAFEGPEKLLEVWFSSSPSNLPAKTASGGLKAISAEVWKDMLDLVNCKVLSVVESEQVDAYLLSESSMFVFPHKLILKTCGTTTLLCGLPRILEIAALLAHFPHQIGNHLEGVGTSAVPYRVFYSRKNFLFPDRQRGPHRSWRDEVKSLDRLFQGGSAYMIGKMNGEHWYLYLTEPNTVLTPPSTPEPKETQTKTLQVPTPSSMPHHVETDEDDQDETLEILMTDLDPAKAKQFHLDHAINVAEGQYYQQAHEARVDVQRHMADHKDHAPDRMKTIDETDVFSNTSSDPADILGDEKDVGFPEELVTEGHALGTVVSEASGLAKIYPTSKYPDARIDAYLFTPCGFSANAVIPAAKGPHDTHYFTVHVTPEPNCSYASFETNVPNQQSGRETADVIEQVVNIFRPGRFSVTLFEGKKDQDVENMNCDGVGDLDVHKFKALERQVARRNTRLDQIQGYRRVDRIVHDLEGYELIFKYYERLDWKGGAPRLGEVSV